MRHGRAQVLCRLCQWRVRPFAPRALIHAGGLQLQGRQAVDQGGAGTQGGAHAVGLGGGGALQGADDYLLPAPPGARRQLLRQLALDFLHPARHNHLYMVNAPN